jgi:hypothetical protein
MKENTQKEFEKALNYIIDKNLTKNNNSFERIQDFKVDKIVS